MPDTTFADSTTPDPQVASSEAQASATPNPTLESDQTVALVVGDRAFKTKEEVVNKITNQDEHIATIEQENQSMRDRLKEMESELAKFTTVNEMLETKDRVEPLTPEQVAEIAKQEALGLKQSDVSDNNIRSCMEQAETAFGDEYKTVINKTAGELGLSVEDIDGMARSNPKLFAKTFLPSTPKSPTSTSHKSTINTSGLQETPPAPKKNILEMSSAERTKNLMAELEAYNQQLT